MTDPAAHPAGQSRPSPWIGVATRAIGYTGVVALVALSAIVTRESRESAQFAALVQVKAGPPPISFDIQTPPVADRLDDEVTALDADAPAEWPLDTRWFNGRPVRPTRTMSMLVTAYSPDHRSCGHFADGKTASLHSVHTNNSHLVAADSRVLPLGSMITVPGYADNGIVPVLDRGGAIKGNRLDVLFPTHKQARKWGVRRISVVVWEYADGLGPEDFRAIRDSRN